MNRNQESYLVMFPLIITMMIAMGCSSTRQVDPIPEAEAASLASQPTADEIPLIAELSFPQNSAQLDSSDKTAIDDLIKNSQKNQVIDEVKVMAWADQTYSKGSLKDPTANLPAVQKKLADSRSTQIKKYIKETYPALDVEVYNMAKRPGAFQELYKSSDARTQQSFENAGLTTSEADMNPPAKMSKALVVSIPKK